MPQIVTLYGIASLVAALSAYLFASAKRRNRDAWAFWCFMLPPLVVALMLLPKRARDYAYHPPSDDDDVFHDLGND